MFRRTMLAAFMAALTVTAAAFAFDEEAPAFAGDKVIRVHVQDEQQLALVQELTDDFWSHGIGVGDMDVRMSEAGLDRLDAAGVRYDIVIDDLAALIAGERARLDEGGAAAGAGWYDDFKDLNAIVLRLNELQAAHPELVELIDIGDTIEGRDIWAVKLTAPGGGVKPGILYNGTQHAREWVSPMTVMYIVEALATQYGTDPKITGLMDGIEFYIVPVVNPDGYSYSWQSGATRLWRKNRRDNGDGTFGVDLNRNWAYEWGGGGSSPDTNSDIYHGTGPFSEPETSAVRDYYLANDNIVASIDFHSYGEYVLYPWAYTDGGPGDTGQHASIAGVMREAILLVNGLVYTAGPVFETLYQASGGSVDWSWGAESVISYTIELRGTGIGGFVIPPEQIIPTAEENLPAALAMAEAAAVGLIYRFQVPPTISADSPTIIPVSIESVTAGALVPGSAALKWRDAGSAGAFGSIAMNHIGGDSYEAVFPVVPCGDTIEFYLQVDSLFGTTYFAPLTAPDGTYETTSISTSIAFADDFEADLGWSVQNIDLLDGQWDRGVPAGGGDRGDPPFDFDGSGSCYLTDNEDGNSDVDGGPTVLTSAVIDITSLDDPFFGYARWFTNDDNDIDRLVTELSNDGGSTWALIESTGNTGGWGEVKVRVADFLAPSSTMVIRFTASDNPNDSVTEAAVDAVRFFEEGCDETGIPGDVDGDGDVDFNDLLATLAAWGPCPACPEDIDGNGVVDFADLLVVLAGWTG